MDNTPWRMPELPPRTGSKANSKPTAQSCQTMIVQNFIIAKHLCTSQVNILLTDVVTKKINTCRIRVPIVTWPWRALILFLSIKNFKTWNQKRQSSHHESKEKLLAYAMQIFVKVIPWTSTFLYPNWERNYPTNSRFMWTVKY